MRRKAAVTAVIGLSILVCSPRATLAQKKGPQGGLNYYRAMILMGSYKTEGEAREAVLEYANKHKVNPNCVTLVGKIGGKKGRYEFEFSKEERGWEEKKPKAPAGSKWSSKKPTKPGEVTVILPSGSRFTGMLVIETDEFIKIKTPVAEMQWDKKRVKEILRGDTPGLSSDTKTRHRMYGDYPTQEAATAAAIGFAKENRCRIEQVVLEGKIAGKYNHWAFVLPRDSNDAKPVAEEPDKKP